jgi:hypothetical protein
MKLKREMIEVSIHLQQELKKKSFSSPPPPTSSVTQAEISPLKTRPQGKKVQGKYPIQRDRTAEKYRSCLNRWIGLYFLEASLTFDDHERVWLTKDNNRDTLVPNDNLISDLLKWTEKVVLQGTLFDFCNLSVQQTFF